ncbi:MAG: signal recognition particle-docking protein FtsY [Ignavibacteria bacterium]|nr:signal recognition particle-docking protein FtsY [Ignavibacteria bacterium]
MGLSDLLGFSRLKTGLTRTRDNLTTQISRMVKGKTTLDDALLEEIEEMLIGADAGIDTSVAIAGEMKRLAREKRYVNDEELNALLREAVLSHFKQQDYCGFDEVVSSISKPVVVVVVGVNGVGKTTSIGKLANRYRQAGKKVLIAAADTFRAAANEQLEVWAARAGAGLLTQKPGADPAAVAFDSYTSARSSGVDLLIIDTAGRLHTRVNLMEELRKISRVLKKVDPSAPHEVLLVLDASTGQNGLNQAKQFKAAVDVSGIILTKLDGTAKGGIILAITSELGLPVRFIGVGEGIDDLEPFSAEAYVESLFGSERAVE